MLISEFDQKRHEGKLPQNLRVSYGSAVALDLAKGWLNAEPTTAYLLTYHEGRCSGSCAFCPQSRTSISRADKLSRINWPLFKTNVVIRRIARAYKEDKISRVCIQALNYPAVVEDIVGIVKAVRDLSEVQISVSCQPLEHQHMLKLSQAGVNRVSVALDAVTKNLFDTIKGLSIGGPYDWDGHMKALEQALGVFGQGNVTTHLIAGLGENEEEIIRTIQKCVEMGIYPALFAFTPVEGTKMADRSQPALIYYRRLQLAHFLIMHGISRYNRMLFEDGCLKSFGISRNDLRELIETGEPFITSGCPGCNRPFYNERPSGPIYNYPKNLDPEQIREILESFSEF